MQFYQLACLVAVAEQKSFSRAAKMLFLSQSTVSNHISNLEQEYGQKLFDRLGKEVRLTPFGEKMYHWAGEILRLREKAEEDLRTGEQEIKGQLLVAASTVPAQYMLPSLLAQYYASYPRVVISLSQGSSMNIIKEVLQGQIELAFVGEKYEESHLVYRLFRQEHLVLITPRDRNYPATVSLPDLLEEPFIFRQAASGTQDFIEKVLQREHIHKNRLQIVGYFDSPEMIKQLVARGVGVSIISETAALDSIEQGLVNAYAIHEMREKRSFYIVHHRKKTLSPAAQKLLLHVAP